MRFNNTLINFYSQIGKFVEALYGSHVITRGCKKAFLVFNVLEISSYLVMQIVSIYTLSIGNFLTYIFVTVVHIIVLNMINENVPVYLIGRYKLGVQAMACVGYFLVLGSGQLFPKADFNPEL